MTNFPISTVALFLFSFLIRKINQISSRNLYGIKTQILSALEIYYNYNHFRPGIKNIILDLVFLKTLFEPFVDCYYASDCPYNYILARFRYGVQLTFLIKCVIEILKLKWLEHFANIRMINGLIINNRSRPLKPLQNLQEMFAMYNLIVHSINGNRS